MSWRMLPIKRQAARQESKSVNTRIFWAAVCSTQSLSHFVPTGECMWLLSHMAAPWFIPHRLENSKSILQGTGAIHSANILLQSDSFPYPSRKSCVWEDNRLAKVRNELLLYCLNKSQKCGLKSILCVTCQGSIFNLLLRTVELNMFC